jgi:hypothetical protein
MKLSSSEELSSAREESGNGAYKVVIRVGCEMS